MSSGRLPSPPPAPEIQLTPDDQDSFGISRHSEAERQMAEQNSRRRVHPGTKAAEIETGPPLVPISKISSPFPLQEHLAALHHHHTQQGKQALTREAAVEIARPPPMVEDQAWIYELCRFLVAECNKVIVGFLFDTPPCSASTCPEMRASEWQFLCAVHEQPKSCCAIDYCCHTLDWAANVVTDPRTFPNRLAPRIPGREELDIGKEPPPSAHSIGKSLVNVFRRVHRIFAHAWFQHRSVFWAVEATTGLYLLFKVICDTHRLLIGETYRLPPEAEGLESTPAGSADAAAASGERAFSGGFKPLPVPRRGEDEDPLVPSSVVRSNTRRHIRGSPSTGSAVTTVIESEDEEEGSAATRGRLSGVRTKVLEVSPSRLESHDEGEEMASVPVIVEHIGDITNGPLSLTIESEDAEKDDDAATAILHESDEDADTEAPAGDAPTLEDQAAPAAEADSESEAMATPESSDQEQTSDGGEGGEDGAKPPPEAGEEPSGDEPAPKPDATEGGEETKDEGKKEAEDKEAGEDKDKQDEAEDKDKQDEAEDKDKQGEAEDKGKQGEAKDKDKQGEAEDKDAKPDEAAN